MLEPQGMSLKYLNQMYNNELLLQVSLTLFTFFAPWRLRGEFFL